MYTRLVFAMAFVVGAPALSSAIFFGSTTTTTTTSTIPGPPPTCGDNQIEGTEKCDGTDVGGKTCSDITFGFAQGGVLKCNADCASYDATDCRRALIAGLLPANGGPGKNRCQLEWGTVGTTTDPRVRTTRVCSDGDPACDQDHDFNNACTIRIQVCLNVPDDRIGNCSAAKIVRLDVLQPSLNSSETNQKIVSGVMAAGKNAAFDQGHISGNGVSYAPPITSFACGSSTVVVPVRGTTGHAKPGKVRIRARTTDNSGRTKSVGNLVLVCTP